MGWGTFIAGRVLRQRRPEAGFVDGMNAAVEHLIDKATDFEYQVLQEISRLKKLGLEINMDDVRNDVRRIIKARKKMGRSLKLAILQKAQQKMLEGDSINYEEIEREILLAYNPFPWERILKPLFPDYYRAKKFINKNLKRR